MKPQHILAVLILAAAFPRISTAAAPAKPMELHVVNPIALDRPDCLIRLPLADLLPEGAEAPQAWDVRAAGMPVPAQTQDGELLLLLNLAPRQERVVILTPLPQGSWPRAIARTQADLAVRVDAVKEGNVLRGGRLEQVRSHTPAPDHWDHDRSLAHEGPGWESDRVAYRLYLDERAVTDLFAKKRPELVMHNVGRDSSYHVMADWGMDVLEVGDSLGDGSIGVLRDGKATQIGKFDSITATTIANGPILAGFDVKTAGWSFDGKHVDLIARYVIAAGSRLTEVTGKTAPGLPMVAGIVKHEGVSVLSPADPKSRAWAYIGTWGKQSLADPADLLGLAFFYPVADVARTGDDGQSLYALYADSAKPLRFAAGAAWAQELGGVTSEEAFRRYLEDTADALSHPLQLRISH